MNSSERNADRTVLVTGGCGYIGSHTIVCLLEQNYNVVVVDNLTNSSKVSLDRVCEIVGLTGNDRKSRLRFCEVDICNEKDFRHVFIEQQRRKGNKPFFSCIHLSGLKVSYPSDLRYKNIYTTLTSFCSNFIISTGRWRKYSHSYPIL